MILLKLMIFTHLIELRKNLAKIVLDRIKAKGSKMKEFEEDYPVIKLPKTIEIGGEGKNQLYNKTIPAFLKKYGKKWNIKFMMIIFQQEYN